MKLGKQWVSKITRSDDPDEWIPAVSEIPSGSCCKYKLDKITGHLELDRVLAKTVRFPTSYGFIPGTRSPADGEETDVLLISCEPLLPLCHVKVRIVGGYTETVHDDEDNGPEDKLVGVVLGDPNVAATRELTDVSRELRDEIETFVKTYKADEDIEVSFDGWYPRADALIKLHEAFRRGHKRAAK
jgi:inorganic pyrophosphatase